MHDLSGFLMHMWTAERRLPIESMAPGCIAGQTQAGYAVDDAFLRHFFAPLSQ